LNNAASMLPIVLIGGGGHASVLADILLRQGREIVAVICPDDISQRKVFSGMKQLTKDSDIKGYHPDEVCVVNGIGIMPKSRIREKVTEYYLELGYRFESVVDETARVSEFAELGQGVQVFANATVQTGAKVNDFSVVNTGAVVEHDCQLGMHNHIAPNATLCGQVFTDNYVYIGANATVFQCLSIGESTIVGAGAIVTKSLSPQSICYPSRSIIKSY
jgi:sugar O-acyltransferase (sialic acid O-acetyltransferase NeuD family)